MLFHKTFAAVLEHTDKPVTSELKQRPTPLRLVPPTRTKWRRRCFELRPLYRSIPSHEPPAPANTSLSNAGYVELCLLHCYPTPPSLPAPTTRSQRRLNSVELCLTQCVIPVALDLGLAARKMGGATVCRRGCPAGRIDR